MSTSDRHSRTADILLSTHLGLGKAPGWCLRHRVTAAMSRSAFFSTATSAAFNASTGKAAGYINPQLYQNPKDLRDISSGNNGDFAARAGWDACTGLGSPNGAALLGLL